MISPKQAFDAVKTLWPDLNHIKLTMGMANGVLSSSPRSINLDGVPIDWAGTAQYPLPEPKWRPAEWPRDAANPPKKCRFKDDEGCSEWSPGVLYGYSGVCHGYPWKTNQGPFAYCEVVDE